MKNYSILKMAMVAVVFIMSLSLTGCRDGSNSQGTDAATEANGNTAGSESPADNENSGSTPSPGSETGASAQDTTTTTNNGNRTAPGSGAAGTENI